MQDHGAIRIMLCDSVIFFFFNDTATTEIYTLSLHDALPIYLHLGARAGLADHVFSVGLLPDRSVLKLDHPLAAGLIGALGDPRHIVDLFGGLAALEHGQGGEGEAERLASHAARLLAIDHDDIALEIGRASCRERV